MPFDNNTIAAVTADGGHTGLESTRPFKVVIDSTMGQEETIWAHGFNIIDGALMFLVMKMKTLAVVDKNTNEHQNHATVYHTCPKAFAAGVWETVEEVFVPAMQPIDPKLAN
jgi:hypothetical protein